MGMGLAEVAQQSGMQPGDATVLAMRPAHIQKLSWDSAKVPARSATDAIAETQFSFYNDSLYRIVVKYDRHRTEGMTTQDMVEAISAIYGTAVFPDEEMAFTSLYTQTVKVSARWETKDYSINLVQSSYQPSFGLILYSKSVDKLAEAAVAESLRLDAEDAPRRELERANRVDSENRARDEKARVTNKGRFKP